VPLEAEGQVPPAFVGTSLKEVELITDAMSWVTPLRMIGCHAGQDVLNPLPLTVQFETEADPVPPGMLSLPPK